MASDAKTTDSPMISGQKAMIGRMKDAVMPPETGVNVGGVEPRVVREGERKADEK